MNKKRFEKLFLEKLAEKWFEWLEKPNSLISHEGSISEAAQEAYGQLVEEARDYVAEHRKKIIEEALETTYPKEEEKQEVKHHFKNCESDLQPPEPKKEARKPYFSYRWLRGESLEILNDSDLTTEERIKALRSLLLTNE